MALHEAVDEAFAPDDELYIWDELGDDDSCTTTYASSRTNSPNCLTASEFEGDSPDGQIVPVPVVPQQPVLIRQQTPSPSQLAPSSPKNDGQLQQKGFQAPITEQAPSQPHQVTQNYPVKVGSTS